MMELNPPSVILAIIGVVMAFIVASLMHPPFFWRILAACAGAILGYIWGNLASN